MAEAFICYSSEDAIFADLLRLRLRDGGVEVWVDEGRIHAGDEWRRAIDDGIRSADVCLVVLTPASCESPYVTYEWGFALGRGIKVIPLLLKEAELHPRLSVFQYLDFRDTRQAPWEKLLEEIERSPAPGDSENVSERVGDLTVDRLQELIAGAIALANASAKDMDGTSPEIIQGAARGVARAARRVAHPEATRGEESSTEILWVDDRPDNNIHERRAFEALGYRFTLALSTQEALEALRDRRFSAIISDMGRREGPREGYALLKAIRDGGDETPFFIYAGSNAPKHKREAARKGAQGSTNVAQELFELVTQAAS